MVFGEGDGRRRLRILIVVVVDSKSGWFRSDGRWRAVFRLFERWPRG